MKPPEMSKEFEHYLNEFKIRNKSLCLSTLFDNLKEFSIIKTNPRRFKGVYRFVTTSNTYYLKLYEVLRKKDVFRHRVVFWRKWTEWRNLRRLRRRNLNVAEPCFRGMRTNRGPLAYMMVIAEVRGRPLNSENLIDAVSLGSFVAGLHTAGIIMVDLHIENFVIDRNRQIGFFDVQNVYYLPYIFRRWRLQNLAFLAVTLERKQPYPLWLQTFLQSYNRNGITNLSMEELNMACKAVIRKENRKHGSRAFHHSYYFSVLKTKNLKGWYRHGFERDWFGLTENLRPENDLKENRVFKVDDLVVKRFQLRFMHADRCLAAFRMSYELHTRGVNHPRAIAYFKDGRYSYFASQLLENSLTVNVYFSGLVQKPAFKRQMLHKFALWVSEVHDLDIYQRDFKSCNILVMEDDFWMVDLEGVRLRKPSEHDKIYNMGQLNASMSRFVSLKDRLRFWSVYAQSQNIPRSQWRAIWQEIWNVLLKKNTAYYDLAPKDIIPWHKTA